MNDEGAEVDYKRLSMELLLKATKKGTLKIVLFVAQFGAEGTPPLGEIRLGQRCGMSHNTARDGLQECTQFGWIESIVAKNTFSYRITDAYLIPHQKLGRLSDNGSFDSQTGSAPESGAMQPETAPEIGAVLSGARKTAPKTGADFAKNAPENGANPMAVRRGTSSATRAHGLGTLSKNSRKPLKTHGVESSHDNEHDDTPTAVTTPTPQQPKRTRAEIQTSAAERRERLAAEKASRAEAREAERKRRADEKAKRAANSVPVERAPVEVQIVYQKIRESIGCKVVAPSHSQQHAALEFAVDLVATGTPVDRLCEQLDAWREQYHSGRLGEVRSHKPYVGDLRNTFETSLMLAANPERALPVPAAPARGARYESAPERNARNLRAQKALLAGSSNRSDLDEDEPGLSASTRRSGNVARFDRIVESRSA